MQTFPHVHLYIRQLSALFQNKDISFDTAQGSFGFGFIPPGYGID